ncbi:MAG: ABC transporter permease [Dehalococcoidia bacterium]
MQRYIIRRLIQSFIILVFLSIAVFVLLRISPGDPALLQQGINATPERIAAVHRELGLDKPLPVQYLTWVGEILHGNLGRSILTQTDVTHEFRDRFPISFELMLLTLFWTVLFGIPFGILSAMRRSSGLDYGVRFFAIAGLAVPSFWVATLVLIIPAQQWGYAPPLDQTISIFKNPGGNIQQFIPASLVLALGSIAGIMRLSRSTLLEVLRQDYVRTARAKGLKEQAIIIRHALQNSMIPVITVLGLTAAGLLGGAVIIENIFALHGLGAYIFASILQKDFSVVQTLAMFTAATVVLLNLLVDLSYAVLDPRIRYS